MYPTNYPIQGNPSQNYIKNPGQPRSGAGGALGPGASGVVGTPGPGVHGEGPKGPLGKVPSEGEGGSCFCQYARADKSAQEGVYPRVAAKLCLPFTARQGKSPGKNASAANCSGVPELTTPSCARFLACTVLQLVYQFAAVWLLN